MWFFPANTVDNTVSDLTHLRVDTRRNPPLCLPHITPWNMDVGGATLQSEPSLLGAKQTSLSQATGCCSPGTVPKMQKSWSSTAIWMGCVARATTQTCLTSEKLDGSLHYSFILPVLNLYQSCAIYSSSVLLIHRLVKCAPSLREVIV